MTCNGIIVENYEDMEYMVVMGNGNIETVLISKHEIITIIDGEQYLREVGMIGSGPCAGTKLHGWSIFLPPKGQCVDKPMTISRPLFEHWEFSGTCKAICTGQSTFIYPKGVQT
ncbi:uncharacterized protein LOC128956116 [Oppia nitens]|uniref:uncharacterized protein LOC128956116 n=1 Tax=Oppia nitens TaxID=1686743 RepID=UPI0023DB2D02|nr:uncharacterized protein LOC128956116 [Oppia nitens]